MAGCPSERKIEVWPVARDTPSLKLLLPPMVALLELSNERVRAAKLRNKSIVRARVC